MRIDMLKKFVSMRESLTKEKSALEARLAQINSVLAVAGGPSAGVATSAAAVRYKRSGRAAAGTAARVRSANRLSLREAVLQATRGKAMTRQEILEAVKKLGYKF